MLRFTIRDVLWLTALAMGVAWWLHVKAVEARHADKIEEINREIRSVADYAKGELKRVQDKYQTLTP